MDQTIDRQTRRTYVAGAGDRYAVTFKGIDGVKLQAVVVDESNEKVSVEVSTTKQRSEKGVCCFHKREGVREIQALSLPPCPNAERGKVETSYDLASGSVRHDYRARCSWMTPMPVKQRPAPFLLHCVGCLMLCLETFQIETTTTLPLGLNEKKREVVLRVFSCCL